MAFIDTEDTLIDVEIQQIDVRRRLPAAKSGLAAAAKGIQAIPLVVRVRLDDGEFAKHLPAGSTGTAAIFLDWVKAAHIICKAIPRQTAILNFINPF